MARNPKFFGKKLRLNWSEIIIGLAGILLGLVLLFLPGVAADVLLCGIGGVFIVIGLVHIVRYLRMDVRAAVASIDMALGLTWLVGGILVICLRGFLISLLPIFFGLVILIGGIAKIQGALSFRRMNAGLWYLELIGAAVSLALGTIILLNPFSTALLLMRIIGAALLIEGVQDLISIYKFKKLRDAYFVETNFHAGGAR